MEKSRLTTHAYEEGHCIQWEEAKAVQTETSNISRKCKEVAHMEFNQSTKLVNLSHLDSTDS
jgi:hypothetical protein